MSTTEMSDEQKRLSKIYDIARDEVEAAYVGDSRENLVKAKIDSTNRLIELLASLGGQVVAKLLQHLDQGVDLTQIHVVDLLGRTSLLEVTKQYLDEKAKQELGEP